MDWLDDAVSIFIYVIGALTLVGFAITAVAMVGFAVMSVIDGGSRVRDFFADLRRR